MTDNATTTLQARLDPDSKRAVEEAARLRHVGISDYIRLVLVQTAKREVEASEKRILQMTADEQERLWDALQASASPSPAQQKLGKIMQGDM
ncbi:MAG: DUF1778 domain-containing protein [Deltaproteobacteria bacterium]|nr:DUF1778 domain-containing protein [Deltaproteobacteria bacterium]